MTNLSLIINNNRTLHLSTFKSKDTTYMGNLTTCFSLTCMTPCSLTLYSNNNLGAIISLVRKSRLRSFSTSHPNYSVDHTSNSLHCSKFFKNDKLLI